MRPMKRIAFATLALLSVFLVLPLDAIGQCSSGSCGAGGRGGLLGGMGRAIFGRSAGACSSGSCGSSVSMAYGGMGGMGMMQARVAYAPMMMQQQAITMSPAFAAPQVVFRQAPVFRQTVVAQAPIVTRRTTTVTQTVSRPVVTVADVVPAYSAYSKPAIIIQVNPGPAPTAPTVAQPAPTVKPAPPPTRVPDPPGPGAALASTGDLEVASLDPLRGLR